MPLLEERASIDKCTVTTGKVRVVTHTETVEELVRAVLEGEEADVSTVELDQTVSGSAPRIRTEDGVTIIPVLEEILVVEKRLVLKREIRIRTRPTSETVEIPVSLRKQRATVERQWDFRRSACQHGLRASYRASTCLSFISNKNHHGGVTQARCFAEAVRKWGWPRAFLGARWTKLKPKIGRFDVFTPQRAHSTRQRGYPQMLVSALYLLEQFGGATGELTAALQYWVQSFHVENAGIRDMLQDIAIEELSHLEMVGKLIAQHTSQLDEASIHDAPLFKIKGGGPHFLDGQGSCWTAAYIQEGGNVVRDLRANISAEAGARQTYESLIKGVRRRGHQEDVAPLAHAAWARRWAALGSGPNGIGRFPVRRGLSKRRRRDPLAREPIPF